MGGAGNHRPRAHARSPDSRGYRRLRPQEFHAASASIIGDTLVRAGRHRRHAGKSRAALKARGRGQSRSWRWRPRGTFGVSCFGEAAPDAPASREWGDRRDRDPFAPAGRPTPDWAVVHRELNKPGVTRILLWQEYLAQH